MLSSFYIKDKGGAILKGIEFLRKMYNMTMEELGGKVGVSRQCIDIWEKKKDLYQKRS